MLYPFLSHQCKFDELIEAVNSMIEDGYRYKNIEKALGPGSALLLGNVIAESM